MDQKHSIRTRIYRLFATFTLFTCLSYSLLLLGYSWVVEDNVFNNIVSSEARFIEGEFERSGKLVEPRAPFLQFYDSWAALPSDLYRQHLIDPGRIEFIDDGGHTLHVRPMQLGGETRILVADVSAFEVGGEYLPYVTLTLLIILALFMALALTLAWPVARAASQPLIDLQAKVEAINLEELEPGFATSFPENEIGYLAHEIERRLLHIKAMMKRESDFTRDISHELRTPTTILKNLAQKAQTETTFSAKEAAHFTEAVQDLEQTITTLLALAREENQLVESVVLLHALENCVIRHPDLAQREDFDLSIEVPETLVVSANRNLLNLLINNLLSNAVTHGAAPALKISVVGDRVSFENPVVRPLPNDPLSSRSKGSHSDGLGLGLYLVRRICDVLGWCVDTDAADGAFRVKIDIKRA